jgi:hypothetical protein
MANTLDHNISDLPDIRLLRAAEGLIPIYNLRKSAGADTSTVLAAHKLLTTEMAKRGLLWEPLDKADANGLPPSYTHPPDDPQWISGTSPSSRGTKTGKGGERNRTQDKTGAATNADTGIPATDDDENDGSLGYITNAGDTTPAAEVKKVGPHAFLKNGNGCCATCRLPMDSHFAKAVGTDGSLATQTPLTTPLTDDDRRRMARDGRALPNGCLAGETLVATPQGPKAIADLVGAVTLLTDQGWRAAEVRCFGVGDLAAVVLRRNQIERTVFATLNHRWYLESGRWVQTEELSAERIPFVEIPENGRNTDCFYPAESVVAAGTQESPNLSGSMVMVDMERSPLPAGSGVSSAQDWDSETDGALTPLLLDHLVEVGIGDTVLSPESTIASGHPSFVSDFNALSSLPSTFAHTEPALVPAGLPLSDVEVSVGPLDFAGSANNRALIVERDFGQLGCLGDIEAAQSAPSVVVDIAPPSAVDVSFAVGDAARGDLSSVDFPMRSAEPSGVHLSWASLDGARFGGRNGRQHDPQNIPSQTSWEVVAVMPTSRREPVFCAVVPELHRFVLADGILTGNSFPIPDEAHLHAAIRLVGQAQNPDEAMAHITRRAQEMGLEDALPDAWSQGDENGAPQPRSTAKPDDTKSPAKNFSSSPAASMNKGYNGGGFSGDVEDIDADSDFEYLVLKSAGEERYTLGPLYMPDTIDAHGEWATASDLRKALRDYVETTGADRTIYLQHSATPAGHWVEVMQWPHEVRANMMKSYDGGMQKAESVTLPADTVYMGVVWEPWAWEAVKKGQIGGLSMGGWAARREGEPSPFDKARDLPGHPFRGNQFTSGEGG